MLVLLVLNVQQMWAMQEKKQLHVQLVYITQNAYLVTQQIIYIYIYLGEPASSAFSIN